jgi:TonB family protein
MRRLTTRRPLLLLRELPLLALMGLLVIASISAAANEPEHRLRDQYQGKVFVLRGFYTGDRLRYDSAGAPGDARSGDWTTDGFVLLSDIHISDLRLRIKAKRLSIGLGQKGTFEFLADNPKAQKKAPPLQIEVELPQMNPSVAQVDAILSKIFLAAQDSFAELVPDYWKPCIPDGLSGKVSKCFFSPEFSAIPGFASPASSESASDQTGARDQNVLRQADYRRGSGNSPPRIILQHEPEFSDPARLAKYQGTVTLGLVISQEGLPTNIHILSPLGCGLDAKAVQAVEGWRFKPAEKQGQPMAAEAEIAVEVDFHLY